MFWALAAGKIDTDGRRYVHELGDIESLNRRALRGELEVTAVSLHAYAHLAERYALLAHGASFGDGYGPRIVAPAPRPVDPRAALGASALRIAVPGELTTAFLALKLFQPAAQHVVVPFDQIEDHVAAGRADAGLLIHEGQLTFADRGLHLWVDLGEWWRAETGLPLPPWRGPFRSWWWTTRSPSGTPSRSSCSSSNSKCIPPARATRHCSSSSAIASP